MGRAGQETVLFYNLDNAKGRAIRVVLIQMGIRIRNVKREEFTEPVGKLVGMAVPESAGEDGRRPDDPNVPDDLDDEMLVMYGFTEDRLDEFLARMRRARTGHVALKAVITPTNSSWNGHELYAELKKEHEALSGR